MKNEMNMTGSAAPGRIERRKNVRVAPAEDAPVLAYIDGEECQAADISVGGMAFRTCSQECNVSLPEAGYYFLADLLLPQETTTFSVTMEVLGQGADGIVRCAIREIAAGDEQLLDRYVTERLEDVFSFYLG